MFEEQLRSLADYILDNQLYDKYYCTFFLTLLEAILLSGNAIRFTAVQAKCLQLVLTVSFIPVSDIRIIP